MEVKERVLVQIVDSNYSGNITKLYFADDYDDLAHQQNKAQRIEWLASVPWQDVKDLVIKNLSTKETELNPQLRYVAEWLAKKPQ